MEVSEYYSAFAAACRDRNASGYGLIPEVIEKIFRHLPIPSRILDAGCGPGIEAEVGVKMGHEIIGVDFSPGMVELFQNRLPNQKCLLASLESIPLPDNHVDAVLSSFSLVHMNDQSLSGALSELKRVLKPKCRIMILIGSFNEDKVVEGVHREAQDLNLPKIAFHFRSLPALKSALKEYL